MKKMLAFDHGSNTYELIDTEPMLAILVEHPDVIGRIQSRSPREVPQNCEQCMI